MRNALAGAGEVVQVGPLGAEMKVAKMVSLVRSTKVEVLRATIPSGGRIPSHTFPGEIVVHCLQGRVALTSSAAHYELDAGQLVYCSPDSPVSVQGFEDSALLITVVLPQEGKATELVG